MREQSSSVDLTADSSDNLETVCKKRKLDTLVDGSIVNIALKNFMAFKEAKYNAHPKLNFIIGPNGSGKSSLVTALILGFGGSPKDINRGDKVSQFVKSGTPAAEISIELYKTKSKNVNLKRKIFVSNEACHYYIDNVLVNKKKFVELVESLNIKVHNLCQFLPQDRLEDFSKLDSKGLLLNSLQSIENQELLEHFETLKKLANSMSTFDDDQKKLESKLNSETNANLKLETVVSSFTKKKSLEKELLTVLQKRSWSTYIIAWEDVKEENKLFNDAKKHNQKAVNIIKQQKELIKTKKGHDTELKKIVLTNVNTVSKLLENIYNQVENAELHVSSIKELNKSVKNTSVRIAECKESISETEKKLENIKNERLDVDENKRELSIVNEKIKAIDETIFPVRNNLDSVKNKLKNITGKMFGINQELEREKRKEDGTNQLLQRKYPELWKVTNWLRNCDRSMFKGQVFEPLFTQIEMIDQRNAKYIESIIPYRDMIAFVFEYAEDLTKFNQIVKEQRWQKINSISAPPPNFKVNETPNHDINSLKQIGFNSYALDMIKVPAVLKRYFMKNYDMHNIPIGSNEVMNNMQHLPNNVRFFFAGNYQVINNRSKYTGERITRQSQISNDPQFLLFSVNSNLINSLTIKLNEVKKECEHYEQQQHELSNQLKITEDSRQPFFEQKKSIQRDLMKYQNRQNAFNNISKDLESAQYQLKKEEEKSTKFSSQYVQLIDKYFGSMNGTVELLDDYATSIKFLVASAFIVNNCCVNLNEDENILTQLKTLYDSNMNNFNEYLKYVQRMESEFKQILDVALHWSQGVSPYDKELFKSMKADFDTIQKKKLEELDELVVEKKAQLNCLNVDPRAPRLIKEYKERKLRIKDIEKRLANLNNEAQNKENQIESLHSVWLPKLQEFSGTLSKNFQKFLNRFGCTGVIDLDMGLTRYDFHAYGLLIKVQFRNDGSSLKVLDVKSQSGGERALTTALFLLALQEVTHFPFRIVDEINQGMDKVNEKKLMELFMDLFEDRNNQYLVVSPKLIRKLTFKNISIDIIFTS